MITFKERLGKPSVAVQAMIDGLREMEGKGVCVHMGLFFLVEDKTCTACAATATVMKAVGGDWGHTVEELEKSKGYLLPRLANALGPDIGETDLGVFGGAMDDFRSGVPDSLFDYFEVDDPGLSADWVLHTRDWEGQLPKIEEYRDRLIELGL